MTATDSFSRLQPQYYAIFLTCAISLSWFILLSKSSVLQKKRSIPESRFVMPPTWRDEQIPISRYGVPLTRRQSRNRVFISALPNKTSDGLGHRFMIINLELNAALNLGVGYVHRTAKYGSLSPPEDPLAVERLFGWIGYRDIRDGLLQESCASIEYTRAGSDCTSTVEKFPRCTALKPDGPFKHLVYVPAELVSCLIKSSHSCREGLHNFSRQHDEPDTLFQMTTMRCAPDYRDGNFDQTASWFRERYWSHHRTNTSLRPARSEASLTRILPFEEDRLQIAVHVRRGDIFNYSRTILPDRAYADVAIAIKKAADEVFHRDVATTVSIFSEGVPVNRSFRSYHDVNGMEKRYLNENGQRIRDATKHWERMIQRRLRQRDGTHIKVQTFIATDTIAAIHAMACADVFIGSYSGMSLHLISILARGLLLMPGKPGTKSGPVGTQFPSKLKYVSGDIETDVDTESLRNSMRWLGGAYFGIHAGTGFGTALQRGRTIQRAERRTTERRTSVWRDHFSWHA